MGRESHNIYQSEQTQAIQVHLENQVAQLFSCNVIPPKHLLPWWMQWNQEEYGCADIQSYGNSVMQNDATIKKENNKFWFHTRLYYISWNFSWKHWSQTSQDIFWGQWKRQVESYSLMKSHLSRDTCVFSALSTCVENCPPLPNSLHRQSAF